MSAESRNRVARHRNKLRARGLRPLQIWVPDTTAPGFAEEARRQSLAIRNSPEEAEIMDWLESVSVWPDDATR
jgi:hypothetical protein